MQLGQLLTEKVGQFSTDFFLTEKGGTPSPPSRKAAGQKVNGKKLAEKGGTPSPPLLSRKFSVTRVLEHFLYSSYSNMEYQNYAVEKLAGVRDFFSLFKQGVLKGF